jgi:phage terminase large subunit GpA-like protein
LGKRLFTWRLSATHWKLRLWEAASEQLFKRYVRGAPVRLWERIPGRVAESLDCVVYGMAVHNLVTANLDRAKRKSPARPCQQKGRLW